MSIAIETEGKRHYIVGSTFAVREQLKDAGCRWDADRKAWWTGDRTKAESVLATVTTAAPKPAEAAQTAPVENKTVAGRGLYKGRGCYLVGRVVRGRTHWDDRVQSVVSKDGSRVLVCSMDGTREWWADRNELTEVNHYAKPKSITGLRKFAEQAKARGGCPICGSHSCERARDPRAMCDED